MEIKEYKYNDKVLLRLSGKLDTNTSPLLENKLNSIIDAVRELIFDFGELIYITSAGLRVLLAAQKRISNAGGIMYIENTNDSIMEVLRITGFISIFKINTGYFSDTDTFEI